MSVNIVVKPIATYAGVSDTNGGGYVDGLGATYANFCSSSAGPLYTNIEPTTYGYDSTGLYDITHSMTVPTGVICYCRYTDDSASTTLYFYAYLVNADNWQMVYLPVGKTGISSQAVIDDAISNAEAGDELLLLAVGGALAGPVFAATLQLSDGIVLIESPSTSPATYTILASIDGKLDGRYLRGVDEDGDLITVLNADKRPTVVPGANITAMVDDAQAANSTLSIESIVFDGKKSGVYTATYGLYGTSGSSNTLTANLFNVDFNNNVNDGIYTQGFMDGNRDFVSCKNNGRYGIIWTNNSRSVGTFNNSSFCSNVSDGITGAGKIILINSNVCNNGGYGLYRRQSSFKVEANNCILDNNSLGDIYCSSDTTTKLTAINSILNSSSKIVTSGVDVIRLYNSYCKAEISKSPAIDIARIIDEPPFVGGTGDDKYMLDPDHANFASYYNNNTGEIYAGAYGPKVATGGGTGVAGISASRYIGGV